MRALALTGCLLLSAACEPTLRTTDLRYLSDVPDARDLRRQDLASASTPIRDSCVPVTDERRRTTSENWSFPDDQVARWLRGGIEQRFGRGSIRAERGRPGAVALQTLYIKQVDTTMSGVVVLAVDDGAGPRRARGNVTRMNWMGTDREYSRLLSDALDEALGRLDVSAVAFVPCETDGSRPT